MEKKLTAGAKVDKLFRLRERVRKANKAAKLLKADYDELEEDIIVSIQSTGSEIIRSRLATATVVPKDIPTVDDWAEFEKWMYENKALYIMQRRISPDPIKEIMDRSDGKPPPGIVILPKLTLSLLTRSKE
ncbi:MAG: hypothetical protein DRI46_12275 [Chloroflexi bacterium]|nr:MAG: hypothetical protein DRI46_12275 [Chloroflexota bacterium]